MTILDNLALSVCKNCILDRFRSASWGHSHHPFPFLYLSLFLIHLPFNTTSQYADSDPIPSVPPQRASVSAGSHVLWSHTSDLKARAKRTPDTPILTFFSQLSLRPLCGLCAGELDCYCCVTPWTVVDTEPSPTPSPLHGCQLNLIVFSSCSCISML